MALDAPNFCRRYFAAENIVVFKFRIAIPQEIGYNGKVKTGRLRPGLEDTQCLTQS